MRAKSNFRFRWLPEPLIRERTQAGLAATRRLGRKGRRPPKVTDDDIEAAKALLANPDIGVTQIAHRLGVSPETLYRYILLREPLIPPRLSGLLKAHNFDAGRSARDSGTSPRGNLTA